MTTTPGQAAVPYDWSPGGVPMHLAEAGEDAVPYEAGVPEGAPAFWDTHAVLYRPNLLPEFCQHRFGTGAQCGARRVGGTDWCVGHNKTYKHLEPNPLLTPTE